ncbi:MAG: hypothetical protein ACRDK8_07960 [Solirubrobacteraceae bacterium]
MSKRSASCIGAVTCAAALALSGASARAASLPTLDIAISGTHAITVSGSMVSGAVSVVGTVSGGAIHSSNGASYGIVRLDPGVTIQQAAGAVQSHRGDLNALTAYGSLLVSAAAPSTVQTTLTPGDYVAINDSGSGQPGFAPFTVTQSAAPAVLPKPDDTQTAIEFGFRGPSVLHDGTMVRAVNGGWLVHMITLVGVRNAAAGHKVMSLLRAGRDRPAFRLTNRRFVSLLNPASPGAMQQQVLHAKPGYYVEACFMDTIDGREHTRLGMERLVKVVR